MAIKLGDRVRFTNKYNMSTGRIEAIRVFTVIGFDRDWAIVDAPSIPDTFTAEEISAQPNLAFRRIALANLMVSR